MNIIDEMALEAIKDDYFLSLFHTAEKMYWQHILEPHKLSTYVFSSKEYADILTFADILSLSSVADNDDGELVSIKTTAIYEKLNSASKPEYAELKEALIENYIIDNKSL